MSKLTYLLGISCLTNWTALAGQTLDQAEVRLPYSELKQLLAAGRKVEKPAPLPPALLSAQLRVSIENDKPVIDGTFRVVGFSESQSLIPLLGSEVSLGKQDPLTSAVIVHEGALCLVLDKPGVQTLELRLLPIGTKDELTIELPACPAATLQVGTLPPGKSIRFTSADAAESLTAESLRSLSANAQSFKITLLGKEETEEARRPPEPSIWLWQNQAIVIPEEGQLHYQILAKASASQGSGIEAKLELPPDAQEVEITGDDLLSSQKLRGLNRQSSVSLLWKTRGIMDRQISLSYRMPLRPLDSKWQLQAPQAQGTRTRFIIANSPLLAYAAEGLTAPLSSQDMPPFVASALKGGTCQYVEADAAVELAITPMPIAATADGVVTTAEWDLKIEPDGAMLLTGIMKIDHKSLLKFTFDTPVGMKLLTCEAQQRPISPVALGDGILQLSLPYQGGASIVKCSFTGRSEAFDPVEGTASFTLPKIPIFIHSLIWRIDIPSGYQAETNGNLTRSRALISEKPTNIALQKNLCRDERPEIHVFYQRTELNR